MLSKERLKEEIKNTKETNKKIEGIIEQSYAGITINDIILTAFEEALAKL